MDQSNSARDSRYPSLGFGIGMMSNDAITDIYGRSTSQLQTRSDNAISGVTSDNTVSISSETVNIIPQTSDSGNSVINIQRGLKRTSADVCYENSNETRQISPQTQSLNVTDCVSNHVEETYTNLGLSKKSPPSNGKKTKGRVKIKMEYIDNKLRRYTTFSKRKTGIMKKVNFLIQSFFYESILR